MRRHLVLKKDAPDEVEIAVGTEFKKHFKRADEPFAMSNEHADMLLRSTDYFKEVPAKKAAAANTAAAKTAKTSATKATAAKPQKVVSRAKKTPAKTAATDKPAADSPSKPAEDVPAKETVTDAKSETTNK